jgi:hypothetical protein
LNGSPAVIASEAKQSMFPLHVRMAFDHGGAGLLRLTLAMTGRRGRESIRRISYDRRRLAGREHGPAGGNGRSAHTAMVSQEAMPDRIAMADALANGNA